MNLFNKMADEIVLKFLSTVAFLIGIGFIVIFGPSYALRNPEFTQTQIFIENYKELLFGAFLVIVSGFTFFDTD